jgi:hypothetical protein
MLHLLVVRVRLAVMGAALGVVLLGMVVAPAALAGPTLPIPDTLWQPAAGSVPASGNYVYLDSEADDWVGAGEKYLYTPADTALRVTTSGGHLSVDIDGDEWWNGDFQAMTPLTTLEPGYYPDLTRYPFHDSAVGGLSWSGEGRGQNTLVGWFAVDEVTYTDGTLTSLHLRFEQRSWSAGPALHGVIHWSADDTTQPPGPVLPIPDTLWKPAAGSVPATGNYVFLDSDAGDYIGAGREYLYTQANAELDVTASGGHLSVGVDGDQYWHGQFQAMSSLSALQPGYYAGLERYALRNPVRGGLDWYGEGRSSSTLTGWFVVDAVSYTDDALTSIDLRFELHSEGGTPALHGSIHWEAGDQTQPPGPVLPIPDTLWKPAAGTVPASGNYVYLDSEAGDWVGAGGEYLYTPADAVITASATGNRVSVAVDGDEWWDGDFKAMSSLAVLQPGYYPDLRRYPFHSPARGGLDWSGEGRGSNTLTGWFAVDQVTYADDALTSIDLRFELHSEGGTPALHGSIHWEAGDQTQPPGPVLPIPDTLWKPAAGSVPDADHYVYLDSDPGDYIGAGDEYVYTEENAELSASASGGHLSVRVGGDDWWSGDFQAMSSLDRLEPGYYPDLERYPFHNPAKGGLNWSGQGRGSNTLTGWFVVDAVTYTNGVLTSIDLRFEQHSEGNAPALHGAVHWAAFEPAHITGTVANAEHAGLAGVSISAYRADPDGDWDYIDDATTDSSGSYDIGGLRAGSYRVRFRDESGHYLTQWYDGKPDRASATTVTVAKGSVISGIDATLMTSGHITGRVADSGHAGVPGISVTAYKADGSGGWDYVNDVTTAADGTYDVGGLHTADYCIAFVDWSGAFVDQWYHGKPDVESAADVPATAGATISGIDATLMTAGHITGTVRSPGGAGLPDISVTAHRADGVGGWDYVREVTTRSDGTYDLGGLSSGAYRLEFDDWSGAFASQCYDGKPDLDSAADITVVAGATTSGIDVTLSTAGHITGTVTGSGGGLEGIGVTAYRANTQGAWRFAGDTETDRNGSYDLVVPRSGLYRLQFSDHSGAYGVQWYADKPTLAAATDVPATVGTTTSGIDAALTGAGHITGTVRSRSHAELSGVDVAAYQPDGFGGWIYVNDVVTRDDGTYDIGGLATGDYRLAFEDYSGDGFASQYYDNQPDLGAADDVAVTAGARTAGIDAILAIPGSDTTAPTTVVTGAGTTWQKSATVTLTATDNAGGSGVDRTEYRPRGTKKWSLYTAPLVFTADVSTTYDYRSVDSAQNAEPARTFVVNVDHTPPTAQVSGPADGAWLGAAAEIRILGADGPDGSGIASLTYTVNGVTQVTPSASLSMTLPVSPNGTHILSYHATDLAGNMSPEQQYTLHLDDTGPVTVARAAEGRKGRSMRLRYRIGDNLSPQVTGVTITVKNTRGRVVATFQRTTLTTGGWYSVKWRPKASGSYRYSVRALDLAGNAQSKVGSAKVVVR